MEVNNKFLANLNSKLKDEKSIKIVYVCSGNIIRSPYAEYLSKNFLLNYPGLKHNIRFESCGVIYENVKISSLALKWLQKEGIQEKIALNHRPRLLENHRNEFSKVDVFICMTQQHDAILKENNFGSISFIFNELVFNKVSDIKDPYFYSEKENDIRLEIKSCVRELIKKLA